MKNMKTCLVALVATLFIGGTSMAAECDKTNVESYAHPSLLGSQTFEYSTDDGAYVTGGNIVKPKYSLPVRGKQNTMVKTWTNDVLALMKSQYSNAELFNPKMPILRSEWAFTLSEGFDLNKNSNACTKKYSDIDANYWATNWICGALDSGVMIGYPEDVFKPEQRITKAEVFATIAKIVDATPSADDKALLFKGKTMQFIPDWAKNATAEVLATGILDDAPDADKILENEYLSKEQVVYLVGDLRTKLAYYGTLNLDPNAPLAIQKYTPVAISIKMDDRLSAKHSNIGDHFTAKTTKAVTIDGKYFPENSRVDGRVVDVRRPGLVNDGTLTDMDINNSNGYIRVKFLTLTNGDVSVNFPEKISEATAASIKNPFFLSRLLAFPLTGTGRVLGIVGRTGGAIASTSGNRLDEVGDNLGNVFVETIAGHPGTGGKSLGFAFWSVGKGVYDIAKTAVTGAFGVVYEVIDEMVYVIYPSASNDASLNPNEELVIIF